MNYKKNTLDILTLVMVAMLSTSITAHAASPISNVGTAKVNEGELSIEQRMGYTIDTPNNSAHKRFRMRQHLDYGWNDWYATRFVVEQNKLHADNVEHASISLENRFQIFEKKTDGWDGGFRLIYGHSDGDKTPHEIDVRLMAQVPFGTNDDWEFRHNTVLEHDIGENSRNGVTVEFRNQITKALDAPDYMKSLRMGVEMFNDFGRLRDSAGFNSQDHQIGPVIKGSFDNGLYFQTAYRAGISDDGADHLLKLFIGKKF